MSIEEQIEKIVNHIICSAEVGGYGSDEQVERDVSSIKDLLSQQRQASRNELKQETIDEIKKLKQTKTTQSLTLKWFKGYNGALDDVKQILNNKKEE